MLKIKPIHPGEVLREEFLFPMKISAYKIAKDIMVPLNRITVIIKEQRAISSETALLLSKYFGTSQNYWINLQSHYDMEIAKEKLNNKIMIIVPFKKLCANGKK